MRITPQQAEYLRLVAEEAEYASINRRTTLFKAMSADEQDETNELVQAIFARWYG
jgi:hypothetical protein